MPKVKLPNGDEVSFPDHLSAEEIEARLAAPAEAAPEEIPKEERVDFFARRRTPRVISSAGSYAVGARPPRRPGG